MKNCDVIITAAGNSSRMGTDKAFLQFNKSFTFLEQIILQYLNFEINNVIIVLNEVNYEYFKNQKFNLTDKTRIVINKHPELERIYSIQLGARHVKSDYCFIQNCDNPFVSVYLLKLLFDNKEETTFVAPYYKEKGGHPILVPKSHILPLIDFSELNFTFKEYISGFNKIKLHVDDENILLNINTMELYEEYFPDFSGLNRNI